MRTVHSPIRVRGRRPVAVQICWDIPAGLNGSASKPLPGAGHITGGVDSVSGTIGVAGSRRRLFDLPMSATLRHRDKYFSAP
jgi:hypothetical protein